MRCRTLFLPHYRLDLGPTGTCSSCSTCFTLAGEHFGLWAFQRTDQGWPMGLVLVAEAEVGCLLTAKSWFDKSLPKDQLGDQTLEVSDRGFRGPGRKPGQQSPGGLAAPEQRTSWLWPEEAGQGPA